VDRDHPNVQEEGVTLVAQVWLLGLLSSITRLLCGGWRAARTAVDPRTGHSHFWGRPTVGHGRPTRSLAQR